MWALGRFPNNWKDTDIVMILKVDKDQKHPANYRPISLLSNLWEIAEEDILTRLGEEMAEITPIS